MAAPAAEHETLPGRLIVRRWLFGLGTFGALALAAWYGWTWLERVERPIRVGILHSRTGPLKISEESMIDGEVLALEQVNAAGGLLGRKVEWIIADGRSDPKVFAQEAQRLIEAEKVCVIFGGLTGNCRKSIEEVVEPANHLLVFPSSYEGMDLPSSVVCTGPIPNQQVIPGVNWCFENLKASKFFLAGCSQDTWSLVSIAIIKDQLKAIGASSVGEKYVTLDGAGVPELVAAVKAAGPDIVLSTLVGDANKRFFERMAREGVRPDRTPVLSFMIGEDELRDLPLKEMVGNYSGWSYFQSIDSPVNRAFVQQFKERYKADRTTSDSIVAAYNGVNLWAQAVKEVGTEVTSEVRSALRRQSREAPEGIITVDAETMHTWRPFHLGKVRSDGQFDIVWSLEKPVRPVPYPILRSRADWDAFLEKLRSTSGRGQLEMPTSAEPPRSSRRDAGRPTTRAATLPSRGRRQSPMRQ
jgi:ABC-type branched-subunit amino acid transport system substrate-binding protein